MASEGTNEEINHFPGFTELRKRRNTKYNVIYNKRVNYVDAVQAFVVRFFTYAFIPLTSRHSKRFDLDFHRTLE